VTEEPRVFGMPRVGADALRSTEEREESVRRRRGEQLDAAGSGVPGELSDHAILEGAEAVA
jgi:hypothetical protein